MRIPFKSSLNEWYCTRRSLVHQLQYAAAMNLHNSKSMRKLKQTRYVNQIGCNLKVTSMIIDYVGI